MIWLALILVSISAVAKGFCDAIAFKGEKFIFANNWWLGDYEYSWVFSSWLKKYIFSFLADGWHLMDSIRIVSMLLLVAILIAETLKIKEYDYEKYHADHNIGWLILGLTVLGYIYHGIIFELTYSLL